jgi:two-component sensor histidine kinase
LTEPENGKPVAEPSLESTGSEGRGVDELAYRIRQQGLLAEFGVLALRDQSLDALLSMAAERSAQGLNAEFSKVLHVLPDQSGLRIVAACGWSDDIIGSVIGADTGSPAGYALMTGRPVISNHLENEPRFSTPDFMVKHGIKRAINVILQGQGPPFGVLEVDSRGPGEFSERDLAFLQGAANLLGMAIEQRRYEEQLKKLLEHQQSLLKEVNHRVKNSLQLAASVLRLQAANAKDEAVRQVLGDAQARVMAIARAHERLYKTTEFTQIDICAYLQEVCADLDGGELAFEGPEGIRIATDRAIPLAMLVSELITNSMKHAYPGREHGPVYVRVAPAADNMLRLSVSDEGVGLPEGFDPETTKGLGMRLVRAFAQRLDATLEFHRMAPGTEVVLHLARDEPSGSG